MLVLTETTDNIQAVMGGAATTNKLEFVSCWRDITTTAYTPGRTVDDSDGTNDVNIVPAPAASTQRVVDYISIHNKDTVNTLVTIKFDANGTEYILWKGNLLPLETLTYCDGKGWEIQSTGYKEIQVFTVNANAGANFAMTNATQAERFAGNSTRHLFMVNLAGYTQVRLISNKIVGSASANTPLFRAKYYTSFNTTVGNFLQLGASAQVEFSVVATGYADTGWMDLVAGAKADGICIGFTELGGDGAADPALGYTAIMFRQEYKMANPFNIQLPIGSGKGYDSPYGNIRNESWLANLGWQTGINPSQFMPSQLTNEQLYGQNFDFLQGNLKDTIGGKLDPALMQILSAGTRRISDLGDTARRETQQNLASSGFRGSGANLMNEIFKTQSGALGDLTAEVGGLGMQARENAIARLLGLNQFQAGQNVGQAQYQTGAFQNLAQMLQSGAMMDRQQDQAEAPASWEDIVGGVLGMGVGAFAGGLGGAWGSSLFGGGKRTRK